MPIKVANIRLELDESEDGLPEKIATRLGLPREAIVHWRILKKSLDARGHDDIHFSYAAAVDLPDDDLGRLGASPGLETYVPERFDWPEPGSSPLAHRPVIVGAGPAGLFAGYLLARDGYRPLDPRTRPGRQGPGRRRPPLRQSRALSIPKATTSSARGAPARSATASSPRAAPAPT